MGETADRPLQRLSASALLYGRSGSIGAGGTADANSSETDGHTATDGARLTNNSAFTTESNGKDAAREERERPQRLARVLCAGVFAVHCTFLSL